MFHSVVASKFAFRWLVTVKSYVVEMGNDTVRSPANWKWIVGSAAIGCAFLIFAFVFQSSLLRRPVLTETLVGVGTAFMLSGVLFFIEQRFIRQVSDVTTTVVASAIASEAKSLDLRFDELRERMEADLADREADLSETVSAIDVPAYATVANALARANEISAIRIFGVVVQGSKVPGQIQLTFQWATITADDSSQPELYIDLNSSPTSNDSNRIGPARFTWDRDASVVQMGATLRNYIQSDGDRSAYQSFDWALTLENFQLALKYAIDSKMRSASDPSLNGVLIELLTPQWALTDKGLECPSHDYLLPHTSFPERYGMRGALPNAPQTAEWEADRPEWVGPEEWRDLLRLGKRRFPLIEGPLIRSPELRPSTDSPQKS